mmetsp:Transcript_48749/g.115827  ORF Transcript_48749/g.115827 Transcript_48749/m.115827 type:complete len:650 (-) Transcript_48749:8-1957(-)
MTFQPPVRGGGKAAQQRVIFHASAPPYQPSAATAAAPSAVAQAVVAETPPPKVVRCGGGSAAVPSGGSHRVTGASTFRGFHVLQPSSVAVPAASSMNPRLPRATTIGGGVALDRTLSQPLQKQHLQQQVLVKQIAASKKSGVEEEPVPGLQAWLQGLDLLQLSAQASKWTEEQGACELAEIVENLEDFMEALAMEPAVRARVRGSAASTAKAVSSRLLQQSATCGAAASGRAASSALKTAMSVPVTRVEQQSAAKSSSIRIPAPTVAAAHPPAYVGTVQAAAAAAAPLYRTETGASDVVPDEVLRAGSIGDTETQRERARWNGSMARQWTPPRHRWRVDAALLKAPIPSESELKVIDNVKAAAAEVEQATWGDAIQSEYVKGAKSSKNGAFESLRSEFLEDHGKAILRELGPTYKLEPADVSQKVQQRFVAAAEENKSAVDYGFHGTRQANIPSILERGLLVPGGQSGIGVANGSAHGVGIYTALPGQSWLSKGFSDSANMLICGVIDPQAEPSPYADIIEKEEELKAEVGPRYVGGHRNHHKPVTATMVAQPAPAVRQVYSGGDRTGEDLKVCGSARILFNETKVAPLFVAQPKGAAPFARMGAAVSMDPVTVPPNTNKSWSATQGRGGSGQVFVAEVGETFWGPPEG